MDAQYCEHGLEVMNCTRGLEEGPSHPCAQVGGSKMQFTGISLVSIPGKMYARNY